MTKTALMAESTKEAFIYARIEKDLLEKVDTLRASKGLKNRSQAIRCLISWAFQNDLLHLERPEKQKRQRRIEGEPRKDEVIYTRVENSLLAQIDKLKDESSLDTRAQTIRGILSWAFENGASQA